MTPFPWALTDGWVRCERRRPPLWVNQLTRDPRASAFRESFYRREGRREVGRGQ